MKKIFIITFSLIALGTTLYSCAPKDQCKNCEVVTYDKNTGKELNRTSATEYCGASLTAVEHSDPVIVGDEKTVYECN